MNRSEMNLELVQAFQYVDDRYLDIAEQEKAVRSKWRARNHWAVMAACILCLILILGLPVAAIAANWFGLRDLLLPPKSGETVGGNRSVISLADYQGSPEWRALAEWKEILEGYDGDDEIWEVTGSRLDASFARYNWYMVHSREMADKMDELAEKYDLKLHTASYDLEKYPELLESCGSFLGQGIGYGGYMYEDGTFQMEGSMELATGMWDFQLLRSVRGSFHDSMLDIGDVSDYEEWRYEAACGVAVSLALGPDKALVLADLEDCFVTVSVYSIAVPRPAGADEGVTRADLEALADGLDLAALSPVEAPEHVWAADSADSTSGTGEYGSTGDAPAAGKDRNARKLYAATLRNLLYSRILPDGTHEDLRLSDTSKFSVYDVDGDGREELVLCYDGGATSAMWGYVIGYDEGSGELFIQLEQQFDLVFLKNGNLKVMDSHNQTAGEMWPYFLYRYQAESDSYELAGHAHAEDKERSSHYPDEADVSGTGTVYYVGPDGWGEVPIDETDYLEWLTANQGDGEELEIPYFAITEENILAMEQ